MKKIVLALAVALLGTLVMDAQPPRRPEMNPEQRIQQRVERLAGALNLDKEQRNSITEILIEEAKMLKENAPAKPEKGEKPDEETMKAQQEQMKAQRDATDAKIMKVLNPEQAEKYAKIKSHEAKRGPGKGRPHGEMRGHHKDAKGECCKENKQSDECCKENKQPGECCKESKQE